LVRQTVENLVEIGRHLTEAKLSCNHGRWTSWLKELGWTTARTPQKYMAIYEVFKDDPRLSRSELPWSLQETYKLTVEVKKAPIRLKDKVINRKITEKQLEKKLKELADKAKAERKKKNKELGIKEPTKKQIRENKKRNDEISKEAQKRPRMSEDASTFHYWITDVFEDHWWNMDPNEVISTTSPEMMAEVREAIPRLIAWLQRVK
jgi:hypothetical protein